MTDEWPEYSQGVCADGAAILENGVMLTIDEIVSTLNNQAETARCQQLVLDQIAKALGVEVGDVDGIGAAIEGLKRDAERYRFLREQVGYGKHGPSLPCGYVSADRRVEMATETDSNIDKALAAGEAQ